MSVSQFSQFSQSARSEIYDRKCKRFIPFSSSISEFRVPSAAKREAVESLDSLNRREYAAERMHRSNNEHTVKWSFYIKLSNLMCFTFGSATQNPNIGCGCPGHVLIDRVYGFDAIAVRLGQTRKWNYWWRLCCAAFRSFRLLHLSHLQRWSIKCVRICDSVSCAVCTNFVMRAHHTKLWLIFAIWIAAIRSLQRTGTET